MLIVKFVKIFYQDIIMSLNVVHSNKIDVLFEDSDDEFSEVLLFVACEEYYDLYLPNLAEIQHFQGMNM